MPRKDLLRPVYAKPLRAFRLWKNYRAEQRRIHAEVLTALGQRQPVKITIGAGQTRFPGWIATDIPAFDIRSEQHWRRLFPPASINHILAEHVFEHLTAAQFSDFLHSARAYLAVAGRIRIAVPDGNHPSPEYIENVRPGGVGAGAEDHKILYTQEIISQLIAGQGYEFALLEYFDAQGTFHSQPWGAAAGFVSRSAAHDARNRDGVLRYTSLIVDCWLP
ncbi:MAG: hypothetical protein OXG92_00910 [Chloroflexi bacterium]|nr:hypothetical protein [Chloroflexota bacterium]MCY3582245.1 hypothetical protein [Chloroflexota bacterium]MCY3715015.1 hypothetical protein [Chloroflexota bacterium]MDE2650541.1 hypothetical protein [Chloroflexota bacterium]MXV93239.1 hypothetical protein [Chloroflexota bacterium]